MAEKSIVKYVNNVKYWNPNTLKCGLCVKDFPKFKSDPKSRDLGVKLFIEKNR